MNNIHIQNIIDEHYSVGSCMKRRTAVNSIFCPIEGNSTGFSLRQRLRDGEADAGGPI
jgi:hypothetical protein